MAAFGIGGNRALPGRGPTPGFRFTLYAILSIVLMFLDQRGGWLEQARYLLLATAYPIQLAVSSPSAAWHWIRESAQTRETLRAENQRLKERQRALEVRSLRYEALTRENAQLRGLRAALPPVADQWLVAEIINVESDSQRQRVLINRGTRNGVFKGQAVLDDRGLLGQTMRVGPWSAEVILLTDPEHAVPVQIERTGVRTMALGSGSSGMISLPYLSANADIKPGDLIVTSGLGGVFPAGYPVARVTEVHRDALEPVVRAEPTASIDKDREIMLVWFREGHPAAPASVAENAGDTAFQPQAAPPRPAPAAGQPMAPATAQPGKTGMAPSAGGTSRPTGNAPAQSPRATAASPATTTPNGATAAGTDTGGDLPGASPGDDPDGPAQPMAPPPEEPTPEAE